MAKKKKATKKAGSPKKDERFDELVAVVSELAAQVRELREARDATPVRKEPEPYVPKTYVPDAYRKTVLDVLGPQFGIEKELSEEEYGVYANQDPRVYHIIVPEKYSTVTPKEREMGVRDIRSLAVDDEHDLRIFCERIRANIIKHFQQVGKPLIFA